MAFKNMIIPNWYLGNPWQRSGSPTKRCRAGLHRSRCQ